PPTRARRASRRRRRGRGRRGRRGGDVSAWAAGGGVGAVYGGGGTGATGDAGGQERRSVGAQERRMVPIRPVLTFLRSHVPTLSRSYALTRPRRQLLQHGGEEADAEAGGALRAVAVAGVEEGRAGDVHVHPVVGRRAVGAGEVLEEGGGRDRAALAPADVGEVGHVALELLL